MCGSLPEHRKSMYDPRAMGIAKFLFAHSARLSTTTYETLATARPEPAIALWNRAPELNDCETRNSPRYCQRFAAVFINTGIAHRCRVNSSLTALVRAPCPQRTTSGACGLNFLLRQAATIEPLLVGKHDTVLPPSCAWISPLVYSQPRVNIVRC